MDERAALSLVADLVPTAGDDAAVVDGLVLTTDMLHDRTDFPTGTTRYTAGWRAVGASLSDVAATGAQATAAVAVYAAPTFDATQLESFLEGASDVCATVDAEYVGGDLDGHDEFTVASTAVGRTDAPVRRAGATPGEAVCVTGSLGRSAGALRLFERGADADADATAASAAEDSEVSAPIARANALFRFEPRVRAGRAVAPVASAMMDSSDGLARSLHQLAAASDCGFAIESDAIPIAAVVDEVATDAVDRRELGIHFGEDFELVFTTPDPERASDAAPVPVATIGRVTDDDVRLDDAPLPDRGYTHGDD